jgi:hypothetical protein
LLIYRKIAPRLKDVEVLLRKRLIVERVQRSILCHLGLLSCRSMSLETIKAVAIRMGVVFVHVSKVRILRGIKIRLSSLGRGHLQLVWKPISHHDDAGELLFLL